MTEANLLDVRGMYCPEPVLRTKAALKQLKAGALEVLVDSGAPRDNITRFAQNAGWSVSVEPQADGSLRLTLNK